MRKLLNIFKLYMLRRKYNKHSKEVAAFIVYHFHRNRNGIEKPLIEEFTKMVDDAMALARDIVDLEMEIKSRKGDIHAKP